MPNIAYFILAHAHPQQISRLVTQLQSPTTRFYLHIDAKTSDAQFAEIQGALPATANAVFIPRQTCRWGGFSLVDASLQLIKHALKDGFEWGVLLSGQDYPIHSNEYIGNFLSNTTELGFIDIKTAAEFEVSYRYRAWHFEQFNGRPVGKLLQKIQRHANRIGLQRQLPGSLQQIYSGSQWWILSSQACQAVLDYTQQHPQLIKFFRHTLVPDEMFFQTILMHTEISKRISPQALRYVEWTEGAWSPALLPTETILQLQHRPELFARKFSPDLATVAALDVLHAK